MEETPLHTDNMSHSQIYEMVDDSNDLINRLNMILTSAKNDYLKLKDSLKNDNRKEFNMAKKEKHLMIDAIKKNYPTQFEKIREYTVSMKELIGHIGHHNAQTNPQSRSPATQSNEIIDGANIFCEMMSLETKF
jgi:hypothetical protein